MKPRFNPHSPAWIRALLSLDWPIAVLLASFGLLGAAVVAYATTWGPVIYSDAAGYIKISENILAGHGVGVFEPSGRFSPLTHQPPFYPIILAGVQLSGLNGVDAARWLHVVLFGLTVSLTGGLLYCFSRSLWLAAAGCLLVLASPVLLPVFPTAMSEPAFTFIALAGLALFLAYFDRERTGFLVGAGFLMGLALLTRYLGAALILAGGLSLLLFAAGSLWRRVGRAAIFGLAGALPAVVWLTGVYLAKIELPRRLQESQSYIFRAREALAALVNTLWNWFPGLENVLVDANRPRTLLLALCAAGLLAFAVLALHRLGPAGLQAGRWLGVLALFFFTLPATLIVMYTFSDPAPDVDDRMLSPSYPWFVLLLLGLGWLLCRAWKPRWLLALPAALAAAFLLFFAPRNLALLDELHQKGKGYLSVQTRSSPTLRAAQGLPAGTILISNENALLLFYTGRPVYPMAEAVKFEPQELDLRYGDYLADASEQLFRQQGAALVLFDSVRWQLDPLYGPQAEARWQALVRGLTVYADDEDGAIYFYPTEENP
ncbi:MAG: ArnT family glycosyltransferase [Chloroflexota bacterium]